MPQAFHIVRQLPVLLCAVLAAAPAVAQVDMSKRPALVITNEPMPGADINPIHARPQPVAPITPSQISGDSYYVPANTVVSGKIEQLRGDLFSMKSNISRLSSQLEAIESRNESLSANYYANTATINTQLQAGTTPGNPRLVQRLSEAQMGLDTLSGNVAELNALAVQVANTASMGSFLLEATRATYGLSGAVEEDHARLSVLEDDVHNAIVTIDRLLSAVNDDITRTAAYLSSERSNLRTLALAISNGDLYGRSLANRPFSNAPQSTLMQPASYAPTAGLEPLPPMMDRQPMEPRILAKIRFDKPVVNYEQPVFIAANEALDRYPEARFEIVAVHPTTGNAAQMAIESTRSRRNAEKVLRSLTQMGLPADRIDLSYNADPAARTSEVHIYVR